MTEKHKISIDAFFTAEYKKLLNYVRKNMDDRFLDTSPEDIIQDVALSILDKLDLNSQIENLAAYIYRSLKNRIIDIQRKAKNSVRTESLSGRKNENQLKYDIAEEVESDENELIHYSPVMLHEAITQLKPDEQAIIMSTEFKGKTFDELSRKWNIPVGTLLSRKHRALSKLNKIILKKNNTQTKIKVEYGNKRDELEKRAVSA
jgi:RNA polymerase sigma factor (sigma-70 family)